MSNEPERDHDFMKAPGGKCLVCGDPLGGGRHWITRYPDGEHERCRDWSKQPFPFERELTKLRAIARTLREQYVAVVAVGRFLSDAKAKWPRQANSTVREFRERGAKLERSFAESRNRLAL